MNIKWNCVCSLSWFIFQSIINPSTDLQQQFWWNYYRIFARGCQKLAESTAASQHNEIDVERLAGLGQEAAVSTSSFVESDSSSSGSIRQCNNNSQLSQSETRRSNASEYCNNLEVDYILFCKANRREIVLKHADFIKTPCDHSVYYLLHRKHSRKYYYWYKWIYLYEISAVDYIMVSISLSNLNLRDWLLVSSFISSGVRM